MRFCTHGGVAMGFFGGGGDPNEKTNDLLEQQIKENQAELEAKRRHLFEERLDIIKGQGAQTWSPDRNKGTSMGAAAPGAGAMRYFSRIGQFPKLGNFFGK